MIENENSLGGRITLGIIGIMLLGLGAAGIGMLVTHPSSGGVGTYALSGLLGVGGAATLAAAILNPDSLDIDENESLDEAEMRERQYDDEA